ncbi:aminotransferase class III-fold pyridoxal phosphate-dependent enzyme [Streptomyces sp. NPDC101225]|uniref:aminotransferase class III-fold pyridoxal phosphate-dependent enzyme n=1 Tax=Streptomyces sp. NPDC101225 TaxID=3366135 RepID=UPI0038050561
MTVEGADGRRYLDCLSGAGALALGHNHPVVLQAIRRVLDSGAPLHAFDLGTPTQDAFVAELFRTLPPGLAGHARVRFCGPRATDAVEAAFRLVRAATGRSGMLTFSGARHGVTAEAVAMPGEADDTPAERLPRPRNDGRASGAGGTDERWDCGNGGPHYRWDSGVGGPHPRCASGVGGPRDFELAARWAESALDDPEPGMPRPAGVILDPVQSENGVIPVPDAWMRRMWEITADRSLPLIADEVQTGVGRTGAFWAVEHSGVTPDVMVLSKAIGGSLPLAVLVYRDELDVGQPGALSDTFLGNQLAMAAGTATLTYVRENHLPARAAALGARMLDQLRALQKEFACVGDVRGRGLMIGIEFVDITDSTDFTDFAGSTDMAGMADVDELVEAEAGEDLAVRRESTAYDGLGTGASTPAVDSCLPLPAPGIAAAVQRECLRRGLIVDLGGPHASVVRLLPPLTISDEQAAAVLDRLADAVQAVARAHAGSPAGPHRPQEADVELRSQEDRAKRAVRRGS